MLHVILRECGVARSEYLRVGLGGRSRSELDVREFERAHAVRHLREPVLLGIRHPI